MIFHASRLVFHDDDDDDDDDDDFDSENSALVVL